jgi:hypothetical protein
LVRFVTVRLSQEKDDLDSRIAGGPPREPDALLPVEAKAGQSIAAFLQGYGWLNGGWRIDEIHSKLMSYI